MKNKIFFAVCFLFVNVAKADFSHPFSNSNIDSSFEMQMILEKTFLKVDVLRLQILFQKQVSQDIKSVLNSDEDFEKKVDQVAKLAGHSKEAIARVEFLRSVSLDQFLEGIKGNLVHAKDENYISESEYKFISESLPDWYAFLRKRGIEKGDQMLYHLQEKKLRVIYQTVSGEVLLDQTDLGQDKRLSVLGSYFSKKSEFHLPLLNSVLKN